MKNKLLALLLAFTLTCSCMTACGNSSSNADESKTENSSSEVETTTTTAETEGTTDESSSESETEATTTTAEESSSEADSSSEAETTTTTEATTTTSESESQAETTTTPAGTTATTAKPETTTTRPTTQATTRATTKATTKASTKATTKATTKTTSKATEPPAPKPSGTVIAQGKGGASINWKLFSNGCLSFTGSGEMHNYCKGGDVFDAAPWGEHCWKLGAVNVIFSEGITSIGEYSFAGFDILGIYFPNSLKKISSNAFLVGEKETPSSVTIPSNVVNIGSRAIGYHTGMQQLKIVGFTIKGKAGSAAQKYAQQNGFKFVAI